MSKNNYTKEQMDNYANQMNPNSSEYKANNDNHSNQMNPNNSEYKNNK